VQTSSHEDLHHNRLPDTTMELYQTLFSRIQALEKSLDDILLEDERIMADAWVADMASDGSHI